LRTEIRGHGGSTAEPPPEINSRTRRSKVIEDKVEPPSHVLLNTGGNANPSRLGCTLQPSRDVHSVTENVVLHNDITDVDAHSKFNAAG